MSRSRRIVAALLGLVVASAVGVGVASAADPGATTYTGCLNPSSGTVSSLDAGSAPSKKCGSSEVQVTLGGGDITAVTAGTGLTGGATTGDAAVAIAPSYRLPQGCSAPDVLAKWNGTGWVCAPDSDTTYDGTDFALSAQACATGEVVKGINATGNVVCAADKDTTYSGANFAKSGASCPAGKYVSGINGSGDLVCTDLPAAATPTLDVVSVTAQKSLGALEFGRADAACPSGYTLVGGGWAAFNVPVGYAGYYQFAGSNTYSVDGGGVVGGSVSSRAFCARIS